MRINKAQDVLNKCDTYCYIGDRSTMLYHGKKCPSLELLDINKVQGCGKQPERSGFSPCHRCLPKLAKAAASKKYALSNTIRTKAAVMRDEMMLICNECGMHLEFVGDTAFVTTVAGEWFFDPNIRPIQLHHKNTEKRFDYNGNSTGHYHVQKVSVRSPATALGYIYHHEQAEIKRLIVEAELAGNEDDIT